MDAERTDQALSQARFAALVETYGPALYGRMARRLAVAAEAEDLLQEVFLLAFSRWGQVRDPDRVGAWLGRIADNLVRMHFRRRWVQRRWEEGAWEAAWTLPEGAAGLERRQVQAALRQALGKVSRRQRQALVLRYYKGYSYVEMAQLLGVEVGTVRSRLQKARRRLKEEWIMQGKDMQSRARRYTLSGADLKALVAARGFASDDAQRPVLQGVYLDGRRIVATDGHRLFLWEADGLDMEAPLLLGPASALDIPYGDQAVLQVDDQGVKLQVEGKEAVALPVMDMDYVHYEKVLPAASTGLCGVAAGDLTAGLEELAPHLEGRHPLDGAGALEYKPHVELSLSAAAQRLTLGVSKRMGYYPVAGGQEAAVPGRADWHFESSVSARVALAEGEEEFRARYHYPYLRAGLEALGVGADEEVALEFNGPLQAAQWRVAGEADRRVLLMPLRLE